jgi:hypothetical protein
MSAQESEMGQGKIGEDATKCCRVIADVQTNTETMMKKQNNTALSKRSRPA